VPGLQQGTRLTCVSYVSDGLIQMIAGVSPLPLSCSYHCGVILPETCVLRWKQRYLCMMHYPARLN
jgi:hypothetical protein